MNESERHEHNPSFFIQSILMSTIRRHMLYTDCGKRSAILQETLSLLVFQLDSDVVFSLLLQNSISLDFVFYLY